MTFRLMTYNIRLGGKGRGEQIARIINACAPDLVLIQEGTRPALIAQIAADTGMSQWHAFRRQSLGFMSRKPVSHASWHRPRFSHHARTRAGRSDRAAVCRIYRDLPARDGVGRKWESDAAGPERFPSSGFDFGEVAARVNASQVQLRWHGSSSLLSSENSEASGT